MSRKMDCFTARHRFLFLFLFAPLLFVGCGTGEDSADSFETLSRAVSDRRPGFLRPQRPHRTPEELRLVPEVVASTFSAGAHLSSPRRMKLLLITSSTSNLSYLAMRSFLRQIGIPFTVFNASSTQLTSDFLAAGGVGNYQAVVLATGNLSSADGGSTFTNAEWQTLWSYEADYGVRQLSFYTYPGAPGDTSFTLDSKVNTQGAPIAASFTAAGKQQFGYLNTSQTVKIEDVYAYLATTKDTSVTPLLVYNGHALVSSKTFSDGREHLVCMVGHNEEAVHSLLLNYGMLNWVTRSVFVGERHLYLAAHVDDVFLEDDLWSVSTHDTGSQTIRMKNTDLQATAAWQQGLTTAYPRASDFVFDMTFNGVGTVSFGSNDGLTAAARSQQGSFRWLSHTYTHRDMDSATYTQATLEIDQNNQVAGSMGFAKYAKDAIVTGGHTGLKHAATMQAAADLGIHYMAADDSVPGYDNPTPNTGITSSLQPTILLVPRIPFDIDYDVYKPSQVVDEYNTRYRDYWGRDLSYSEILDVQADLALNLIYKYGLDPAFFHQTNLCAYSENGRAGQVLTDLMNVLLKKYQSAYALNLRSLSFHDIGQKMKDRRAFDLCGLTATLDPANHQIRLSVTAAARIPVTGVVSGTYESYGDQSISYFDMSPGTPVTIPLP